MEVIAFLIMLYCYSHLFMRRALQCFGIIIGYLSFAVHNIAAYHFESGWLAKARCFLVNVIKLINI